MSELKIGVIVGSTRPTRIGSKITDWFMTQVAHTPDVSFQLLDLAQINLPFLNEPKQPSDGDYQQEHTKRWSELIAPLDGFVWVTAEYNHGYPAPLKNAIDTLFAEWQHKPVAFVGYGGMGGARAIEQLVQVAATLDMVPIPRPTVNVIDAWSAFDENDQLKPDHIRGNPAKVATRLTWWARTLKPAREASRTS